MNPQSRPAPIPYPFTTLLLCAGLCILPCLQVSGVGQKGDSATSQGFSRDVLEAAIGQASPEVLRKRYGIEASVAMIEAFQHAAELIPLLFTYRISNPMGGVLDYYIEAKPDDTAHYATFQEYAAERRSGKGSTKVLPDEVSRRLSTEAEKTEGVLAKTDAWMSPGKCRDCAADRMKLLFLASLARYHARKILAGASLALFYATGAESELQSAEAHAAAALEIWRRQVRSINGVSSPQMLFSPQEIGYWKPVFARYDVERLKEVRALFERYALFDLGLDFGPAEPSTLKSAGLRDAVSQTVEPRFLPLDPGMIYSPERRYGWLDTAGIESSRPIQYSLLEGNDSDNLFPPIDALYKDFLRGSRRATLVVDLPDGEYRVTSIVGNTSEIASGSFQIRVRGQGARETAITYRAGETGDKRMEARVAAGQLALDFIPEPGKDWLVSGLVFTKHAPHIAHVPLMVVEAGSYTNLVVTVTAPDGVKAATVVQMLPSRARPIPTALLMDQSQFSAVMVWRPEWEGKELLYHITAVDGSGNVAHLPGKRDFVLRVGPRPQ